MLRANRGLIVGGLSALAVGLFGGWALTALLPAEAAPPAARAITLHSAPALASVAVSDAADQPASAGQAASEPTAAAPLRAAEAPSLVTPAPAVSQARDASRARPVRRSQRARINPRPVIDEDDDDC